MAHDHHDHHHDTDRLAESEYEFDAHESHWMDLYGPGLVIAVGVAYILICALWRPVSGS